VFNLQVTNDELDLIDSLVESAATDDAWERLGSPVMGERSRLLAELRSRLSDLRMDHMQVLARRLVKEPK
jgi:hypothetical protein